jgi:hypothetical protein
MAKFNAMGMVPVPAFTALSTVRLLVEIQIQVAIPILETQALASCFPLQ